MRSHSCRQSGTAIPIDGDNNGQPPQVVSGPDKSTSGQGGAFVAPPSPLKQTDYVCLVYKTDQPFCLPPGTYAKQSRKGFEIKDVDALTLPSGGWNLETHYQTSPKADQPNTPQYTNHNHTNNQEPKIKSNEYNQFTSDMKAIDSNFGKEASFTIAGPTDGPDPVCCLSFRTELWR